MRWLIVCLAVCVTHLQADEANTDGQGVAARPAPGIVGERPTRGRDVGFDDGVLVR